MKKTIVLIVLFLMSGSFLYGQSTTPSLQAGLGGITFNKGDLKTEVIAELIAEKQSELKFRLIQTMLLNNLSDSGGAMSAYLSETINEILSGSNNDVKVKKIIENTVNISIALAFINHYVGVIDGEERKNFNRLIISLGYIPPSDIIDNSPTSFIEMANDPYFNNHNIFLSNTDDTRVNANEIKNDVFISLAAYLTDITTEALRSNEFLKEKGLFQLFDSNIYRGKNFYLNREKKVNELKQREFEIQQKKMMEKLDTLYILKELEDEGVREFSSKYAEGEEFISVISFKKRINDDIDRLQASLSKSSSFYAEKVYEDMASYLDTYITAFGLFDFIFRNDLNVKKISKSLSIRIKNLISQTPASKIDINEFSTQKYLEFINYFYDAMEEIPSSEKERYAEAISTIEQLMIKSNLESSQTFENFDQIHLIGNKLIPLARNIFTYSKDDAAILLELRKIELILVEQSLDKFLTELDQRENDSVNFSSFYKLLGAIQNLDNIKSYEVFFQSLYSNIDFFVDARTKITIKKVVDLTSDHMSIINKDSTEYIDLDIEGVLSSLTEIKYDRWNPLSFYFTVGGNYTLFFNDQTTERVEISNFQYFGEKIGFKLKIWDWDYLNSFGYGDTFKYWGTPFIRKSVPKKPVISDFHFLAYGSGLLYNLIGTSTESSINSTMVGIGVGFSFFNGIDLNFSSGIPVGISDPEIFFNVGFDVRFTEYIQALGKK